MSSSTVGELQIALKFDTKSLDKSTKDVEGKVGNSARSAVAKAEKEFDALKTAAGATVVNITNRAVNAAVDLSKSFVSVGRDFSSAMSEVGAITGATGDELDFLEKTAREFGASTVFSASEAANALKYMGLAGWDAQQSADALGGVLDLAAASGMELAAASDMVTDYLSAFGMEAEQSSYFADMLTYAQNNSNTTAAALGEAYKNCAANLNAAGQDVETTTSLLSMMANQGLKGSEAGTALNAVMRDMTAKMKDGAIAVGNTSVKVMEADGNYRDLTDILKDVEKATDGMGDAQKATALSSSFTADSIKGLNLVLNAGVDEAANFEESLRNSGGAAKEAADAMNDNLEGDVKTLQSAFQEFQLVLYEKVEPALREIVKAGTELVNWMSENSGVVIAVAGTIGSALLAAFVTKKIVGAVKTVKSAFNTVKNFLNRFDNTTQTAATSIKTSSDSFGKSADKMGKSGESLSTKLSKAIKGISNTISTAFQSLGQILSSVVGAVMEPIKTLLRGIGEAIAGFFQALANPQILMGILVFTAAAAGIAAAIFLIGSAIGAVTPALAELLNTVLIPLGEFLLASFIVAINAVTDCIIRLTNDAVIPFGEFVRDTLIAVMNTITDNIIRLTNEAIIPLGEFIRDTFVIAVNTLTDAIIRLTNEAIIPLIDKVMEFGDWLESKVVKIVNGIKTTLGEIVTWIDEHVITPVKEFFSGLWDDIKEGIDDIKKIPEKMLKIGEDIVKGLWDGIGNAADWIKEKITGFADGILSGIKEFFGIKSPSRVFRDEVGVFLAEGIGVGFNQEMEKVSKEMQQSMAGDLQQEGFISYDAGLPPSLSSTIDTSLLSNFDFEDGGAVAGDHITINQTNEINDRLDIYKVSQALLKEMRLGV